MTELRQLPLAPSEDPYVLRVRREISDLDRALVELVNKRLRLVARLKHYKDERGIGFVDLAREEWMLRYLQRANRGPLSDDGLSELYHHLLDLMKREVIAQEAAVAHASDAGG
jgi:chorismate mutase